MPPECGQGREQFGDAFQGEIFGLHGDQQAIGGDQGVQGEEIECGRAIEDDEVVLAADRLQGIAQTIFAAFGLDQLHGGADQVVAAGNDLKAVDLGRQGVSAMVALPIRMS